MKATVSGPETTSTIATPAAGAQSDIVNEEGAYLLRLVPDKGGSQALDLAPAQGGFVEITRTEPGNYAFVSHKFNDASRGARGIFQVGAVTSTMSR